jgi:hypothetical protein
MTGWLKLPQDVENILTRASETSGKHVVIEYNNLLYQQQVIYERWLSGLKTCEELGKITSEEFHRAEYVLRGVLGTSVLNS